MNRLLRSARNSATSSLRVHRAASPSSAASPPSPTRHRSDASAPPGRGDDVMFGHVKVYDGQKRFGFLVPDGVPKRDHASADLAFIHTSGIRKPPRPPGEEPCHPFLKRGLRVRFRAAPPEEGGASMRAHDLTLEDGTLVPPFLPNYLDTLARDLKAKFGEKVFHIYTDAQDQEDLETQVVAAFDEARDRLARARDRVERIEARYAREGSAAPGKA